MENNSYIRVALTNLAAYNNGYLIYEWLDLPASDDEIQAAFEKIQVSDKPRPDGEIWEEYFFSDIECNIKYLNIGMYESLSWSNEFAERLEDLDESQIIALQAFLYQGNDPDSALENAKAGDFIVYRNHDTWEDLAEAVLDESGGFLFGTEFPKDVWPWLDWQKLGRALNFSGEFLPVGNHFVWMIP